MRIRSFGKIFGGTAAIIFLATSLCLPINVHAQQLHLEPQRQLADFIQVMVAIRRGGHFPKIISLQNCWVALPELHS
jgi:hypothetical protein